MKEQPATVKVEVLSVTGCPHHASAVARVKEAFAAAGLAVDVSELWVDDAAEAESLGFSGSPTVRIDGEDVEPSTRQTGLACRMDRDGAGLPSRAALTRAIEAAKRRRGLP